MSSDLTRVKKHHSAAFIDEWLNSSDASYDKQVSRLELSETHVPLINLLRVPAVFQHINSAVFGPRTSWEQEKTFSG